MSDNYKYDISVIGDCIERMNGLANENINDLILETQNAGAMKDKIQQVYSELNDLHKVVVAVISATAVVTKSTLNDMIRLDEDFIEITE